MKLILGFLLLFVCVTLVGCEQRHQKKSLAQYCTQKNYRVSASEYLLNTVKQNNQPAVFLIQNASTHNIWLDKALTKQSLGASAGWTSQLAPGNWSALLLQQRNFHLKCTLLDQPQGENQVQTVNCAKAVKICYLPNVVYKEKLMGGFWLTENQPANKLLTALKKRGITIIKN